MQLYTTLYGSVVFSFTSSCIIIFFPEQSVKRVTYSRRIESGRGGRRETSRSPIPRISQACPVAVAFNIDSPTSTVFEKDPDIRCVVWCGVVWCNVMWCSNCCVLCVVYSTVCCDIDFIYFNSICLLCSTPFHHQFRFNSLFTTTSILTFTLAFTLASTFNFNTIFTNRNAFHSPISLSLSLCPTGHYGLTYPGTSGVSSTAGSYSIWQVRWNKIE